MYGYPNQQYVSGYPQPQMGYAAQQPQAQAQPQVQAQAGAVGQVNQANPQVNANAGGAQGSNEFDPNRFKPENGGIAVNPI